jgi:hypothetical protein
MTNMTITGVGVTTIGSASAVVAPGAILNVSGGRSFFSANSELFAVGARYTSTGGTVYFGATDATSTPGVQISAATGNNLMSLQNSGQVTIPNLAGTGDRIVQASSTGLLSATTTAGTFVRLVSTLPLTLITSSTGINTYTSLYSTTATIVNGVYYKITGNICLQTASVNSPTYASLSCSLVQNPTTSYTTNNLGLWYYQNITPVLPNTHFSMNGTNVVTSAQLGGAGTRLFYLTCFTQYNMGIATTPDGQNTFQPTLTIEQIS